LRSVIFHIPTPNDTTIECKGLESRDDADGVAGTGNKQLTIPKFLVANTIGCPVPIGCTDKISGFQVMQRHICFVLWDNKHNEATSTEGEILPVGFVNN
jgi:hypothetical protein